MAKCPKCGAEIDHLKAYSTEENLQIVTLNLPEYAEKNPLDWSRADPVEDTCTQIDFECPDCGNVIYSNNGNSQDPAVAEFLKTGNFPEKKPEPQKLYAYVLFSLSFSRTSEKHKTIEAIKAADNVKKVDVLTASKWDIMVTLEVRDTEEVKERLYGNRGVGGIRYIEGVNTVSQEILYLAP
ncbi:Uncharacterised protein [uncultured archaeon]|nr:Uncharacterised protein [uncultured archaeon]